MILDNLLMFDPANTSLVHGTGTFASTNTLDLGINGLPSSLVSQPPSNTPFSGGARDMGIADAPTVPKIHCLLQQTILGTNGTTTLQVKMQGAPDNGAGAPGAFFDMADSPVYTLAANFLVAGQRIFEIDWPRTPPGQNPPRFVQLVYVIGGAAITQGQIESMIVLDEFEPITGVTGLASGYPAGIVIPN